MFRPTTDVYNYRTRSASNQHYYVECSRTEKMKKSFLRIGALIWNGLSKSLKSLRNLNLNTKSNKFSRSFFTERADRQTERADLTHTWLNQGGLLYLLKWDSDQHERFGYFGHCAHINKTCIFYLLFINC